MNLVHKKLIASLFFALLASLSSAQSLDEIVVQATRLETPSAQLPIASSVVEAAQISLAQPLLGLDESLSGVPGLFMQNRFNFAQDLRISMRGFGARAAFGIRGIRIVVDGVPETLADGQGGVDGIDLGSAERIEVLRGGASALYGNAGGGVILVESERGGEQAEINARLASGSFGYQRAQLKAKGEYVRLNYLLSASALSIDGYRAHSEAENNQLNARLEYALDERSNLLASLHVTDQPVANDAGGINAMQASLNPRSARDANIALKAGEALSQMRLGLRYRREIGTDGSLQLHSYYSDRDFAGLLPFAAGGAIDLQRVYAGGGAHYRREITGVGLVHNIVAGLEYDKQDDDRTRFFNNGGQRGAVTLLQNEQVTNAALFVQDDIEVSPRFRLLIGARFDRVQFRVRDAFLSDGDDSGARTLSRVSPMLGASWRLSDSLLWYANIAQSFETPTTTELANPSTVGGFNPLLDPQLARSHEIGLRVQASANQYVEAAIYRIDLRDELIGFELAQFPGRDFFANAGATQRRGLELAWRVNASEQWQASFAYTYADYVFEKFIDNNGNDFAANTVPGTPQHILQAQLNYESTDGAYAVLEALHVSDQFVNNANTNLASGHSLFNLRGGKRFVHGDWHIAPYLSISNLLDRRYTANARTNAFGGRYFEPGPTRAIILGISITR